jgi:hypothetical protein
MTNKDYDSNPPEQRGSLDEEKVREGGQDLNDAADDSDDMDDDDIDDLEDEAEEEGEGNF